MLYGSSLTLSAILESLRHRNIVQLVQKIADQRNERIYIVMEVRQPIDGGANITVLYIR